MPGCNARSATSMDCWTVYRLESTRITSCLTYPPPLTLPSRWVRRWQTKSQEHRCRCSWLFVCVLARRVRHIDGFGFAKFPDGMGTEFAVAVAAGLHASEWQVDFGAGSGSVKVDQAGFDFAHGAEGQATAFGEDGG